jgi:hypothetical protein
MYTIDRYTSKPSDLSDSHLLNLIPLLPSEDIRFRYQSHI